MDIQEIETKFEDLLVANPDFDESLLEKNEDGCYEDSDINLMYQMFEAGTEVGEKWQAAKAQVPEGFFLVPTTLSDGDALSQAIVIFERNEKIIARENRALTDEQYIILKQRMISLTALKIQNQYKAMISAQQQSNEL